MERRAKEDFERKFAIYVSDGLSKAQAAEKAIQDVVAKVSLPKDNPYLAPVNLRNEPYTSRLESAKKSIVENKQSVKTYPYLSEVELEEGKLFLQGGGDPPRLAVDLARSLNMPTWDFIRMQMDAAGIEYEAERPEVEGEVDGLDPAIQNLLRSKPSPRKTYQAAAISDDKRWVLDQIASKESVGYGEYDAMNTPYDNIGYNSNDRLGQGLSTMSVAQVMQLQ